MRAALLAQSLLAQSSTGDGGLAGPIGLVLVLLIAVATVLLIRNMDRRLKRLPRSFPPPPERGGAPGSTPPGSDEPPRPDAGTPPRP